VTGSPRPAASTVVWWRNPTGGHRPPGIHEIGWVDTTGRPHGRLRIPSPHLRLDPRTIEAALAAHLVPHPYPTQPAIAAAGLTDPDLLASEAQLVLDGHTIAEAELSTVYDLDVVAVATAQLYSAGPRAVLTVDEGLGPAVRDATMTAALRAIADFATTHLGDLDAMGWRRRGDGSWQLLLHQR
jgi:hypothetical protein